MSIEKITSKIISDAQAEAKATMDETKAKCDVILTEAGEKAAQIIKDAEENGRADKEKLINRRKSVADIDGRKLILNEKQKYIASCFDKTIDKITSMEKGDYIDFLVRIVKNTGETEGELILNEKDATAIGEALVQKVATEIPGSRITLSKETRNIRGGFLLKNGTVYMNGTLEALVDEAKEKLIGEVAGQLFQ